MRFMNDYDLSHITPPERCSSRHDDGGLTMINLPDDIEHRKQA